MKLNTKLQSWLNEGTNEFTTKEGEEYDVWWNILHYLRNNIPQEVIQRWAQGDETNEILSGWDDDGEEPICVACINDGTCENCSLPDHLRLDCMRSEGPSKPCYCGLPTGSCDDCNGDDCRPF